LNAQSVSNKHLQQTCTKLEPDVFGVAIKLLKDVVHLWSEKKWNKNCSSSYMLAKQQLTTFVSQGVLAIKHFFTRLHSWKL
jgi:hypothetical protein